MKITVLDKTNIKYNGFYLLAHQTYNDVDDDTANELLKSGEAVLANDQIVGVSYSSGKLAEKTKAFNVKENGGFVAEAQLTEEQKRDLAEKGAAKNEAGQEVAKDETPVTGKDSTLPKDTTPEPTVQQKVYDPVDGHELTDEEIKAKEAAATSGANTTLPKDNVEASKAGQEVK